MNVHAYAALTWSLAGAALLLALGAIPLAYRRVSPVVWVAHGALIIAFALTMAVAAHTVVFGALVPWWRTGTAYLAMFAGPGLATAWAARAAHRRWATLTRSAVALAGIATLLVSVVAGIFVATAALPQVAHYVQ